MTNHTKPIHHSQKDGPPQQPFPKRWPISAIFTPTSCIPSLYHFRHGHRTAFVTLFHTTFVTPIVPPSSPFFIPLSFFQKISTTCQSVNSKIFHPSRLSHLSQLSQLSHLSRLSRISQDSHLSQLSHASPPSHNHAVLATERNHNMLTMILQHESRSGVRCRQAKDLDRGLPFSNRSSTERAARVSQRLVCEKRASVKPHHDAKRTPKGSGRWCSTCQP